MVKEQKSLIGEAGVKGVLSQGIMSLNRDKFYTSGMPLGEQLAWD